MIIRTTNMDFNPFDTLDEILRFLNTVPNREYGDNYLLASQLEKIIASEKVQCRMFIDEMNAMSTDGPTYDERGANELYMEHFYENSKPKEKMSIEEIGKELSRIINQDGDDRTDGECIDEIVAYLRKNNLYTERK